MGATGFVKGPNDECGADSAMSGALRAISRMPRISISGLPKEAMGKYPHDTGCRFQGAKVRLMTKDSMMAFQLGNSLHAKGLPREPAEQLVRPEVRVMPVALTRDAAGRVVYLCWPNQASGDIVCLETTDTMLREPFLRWLKDLYIKAQAPEPEKPKTLTDLANEGEIETIDAKDLT